MRIRITTVMIEEVSDKASVGWGHSRVIPGDRDAKARDQNSQRRSLH
jgi:hypothetical protein